MGSCIFEIHFHQDKDGAKITDTSKNNHENHENDFFSFTSSKTNEKEKEQIIKNKLNEKMPEIGKIIRMKDYEASINQNILTYISNNKLNYKNYLQEDLITYKSFPIQFKNNNIYYGNWNENNEMEGYGIYYLNDQKVVTEGVWNKGNIKFGRIFFKNGDIYEGEMKNSVPHGKGKITFFNKESYTGDFIMGEMTGKGTYIFSDKTMYTGGIKNGLFNGIGKMKWINGIEYNGNFVDSTLCGKGKISNIQGEEYEGNFDKNEFYGEGIYIFNNGEQYEGNYEYGIKKGNGKYKKNDNIIFEGVWNDDLPNGNGTIHYEGNILKGFWRNGNLIGNPEIIEGNINNFNNIDLNIGYCKANINPNSLPHISTNDTNISLYTQNNDLNFV